ncbi:hypothetical protein [Kitasatospora sp. CB02891]|uniref:hypothetical protein n=1 Tax=Kitasatospora sp. CB02891 TaxID=2020329 RepID=UPI000C27E285|nr:hypothetical protein [Kitasatospora sp. CB02891]PJN27776.1 hypothetical protein CG736_06070 [Kitasatospora sp. CB02891]
MSDPQALLVPVEVAAMAATDKLTNASADPFYRWVPKFYKRERPANPEPEPFVTTPLTGEQARGVYLHWRLPDALLRGRLDLASDRIPATGPAFPTIPNRWLVLRHFRPADPAAPLPPAGGWLVHSDYLDASHGTVPYLHEGRATKLGTSIDLAGTAWTEPVNAPFLTAAGPGLPDFPVFQSYNADVLSFHDPLGEHVTADGTISYLVAGWHSAADQDPLSAEQIRELLEFRGEYGHHGTDRARFEAALAALGWQRPAGSPLVHRSLYVGTVLGLAWRVDGLPDSDLPTDPKGALTVAVGNSAADARSALREGAAAEDRLLLEAFDHGVLDELDDALTDHGRDIMNDAAHRTWFAPSPAGFTWQIVDRPGSQSPPPPPTEATAELAWLTSLNARQQSFDDGIRKLAGLRERLYDLWWWTYNRKKPTEEIKTFLAEAAVQLDPAQDGLAKETEAQQERCYGIDGKGGLRAAIPWGNTPAELQARIDAYRRDNKLSTGKPLAAHREVKRVPVAPYQRPTDPVVLISGKGARMAAPRSGPLPCHLAGQLLKAVALEGSTPVTPTKVPAAPAHLSSVTALLTWAPVTALLTHFAVLEEAARLIWPTGSPDHRPRGPLRLLKHDGKALTITDHDGTAGVWPEFTDLWRQPWQPLYLLWAVHCYPLPYRTGSGSGAATHWTFDGRVHRWNGTSPRPYQTVKGRSRLSALPGFAVRARAEEYIGRYVTDSALAQRIRDQAGSDHNRDQISQSLDGLNAWLAQRKPSHHFDPLSGTSGPLLTTEPVIANPETAATLHHFDPVRSAQVVIEELTLVDQFGRVCKAVNETTAAQIRPRRATSVQPDPDPADPSRPLVADRAVAGWEYRYVQLPPRLHQPARTCLEWLRHTDDNQPVPVGAQPVDPGHSPVCGWLVPNPREQSLLVYGADGAGLGELHVAGPATAERVDWLPLPGSPWLTRDRITADPDVFTLAHPHLGGLLRWLLKPQPKTPAEGPPAFRDLLAVIDLALHTIAPPDQHTGPHWTLLAGRPLALVRARVRIDLAAPPLYDATWKRLPLGPRDDDGNVLRAARWPVRLGDAHRAGDGLVGYFTTDPAKANSRATPYHRLFTGHRPPHPESSFPLPIDAAADLRVLAAHADDSAAPPAADAAAAWATLLIDPWASVHAHSGILPAVATRLPEPFVRGPMATLSPALRTGPVLAGVLPGTPVPGDRGPSVALPTSAAWQGSWSWAERTPAGVPGPWSSLPLADTNSGAHPPSAAPVARTGFLTLTPEQQRRNTT